MNADVHGYAYVAAVHKMQCLVCKQQPVLCHFGAQVV